MFHFSVVFVSTAEWTAWRELSDLDDTTEVQGLALLTEMKFSSSGIWRQYGERKMRAVCTHQNFWGLLQVRHMVCV